MFWLGCVRGSVRVGVTMKLVLCVLFPFLVIFRDLIFLNELHCRTIIGEDSASVIVLDGVCLCCSPFKVYSCSLVCSSRSSNADRAAGIITPPVRDPLFIV